ncbi:aspartate kinase, partial [Enterococcus faecalis]
EEIEPTISPIVRCNEDVFDELHLDKAVLADISISIGQLATLPKENNAFLFDYFLASGEDNNAKVVATFFNENGLDARY